MPSYSHDVCNKILHTPSRYAQHVQELGAVNITHIRWDIEMYSFTYFKSMNALNLFVQEEKKIIIENVCIR